MSKKEEEPLPKALILTPFGEESTYKGISVSFDGFNITIGKNYFPCKIPSYESVKRIYGTNNIQYVGLDLPVSVDVYHNYSFEKDEKKLIDDERYMMNKFKLSYTHYSLIKKNNKKKCATFVLYRDSDTAHAIMIYNFEKQKICSFKRCEYPLNRLNNKISDTFFDFTSDDEKVCTLSSPNIKYRYEFKTNEIPSIQKISKKYYFVCSYFQIKKLTYVTDEEIDVEEYDSTDKYIINLKQQIIF